LPFFSPFFYSLFDLSLVDYVVLLFECGVALLFFSPLPHDAVVKSKNEIKKPLVCSQFDQ